MGRTSSAVKNRYNSKAYDQLAIRVPKGRKADIEAAAAAHGDSVNGLVNTLLQGVCGLSNDDWKNGVKVAPSAEVAET